MPYVTRSVTRSEGGNGQNGVLTSKHNRMTNAGRLPLAEVQINRCSESAITEHANISGHLNNTEIYLDMDARPHDQENRQEHDTDKHSAVQEKLLRSSLKTDLDTGFNDFQLSDKIHTDENTNEIPGHADTGTASNFEHHEDTVTVKQKQDGGGKDTSLQDHDNQDIKSLGTDISRTLHVAPSLTEGDQLVTRPDLHDKEVGEAISVKEKLSQIRKAHQNVENKSSKKSPLTATTPKESQHAVGRKADASSIKPAKGPRSSASSKPLNAAAFNVRNKSGARQSISPKTPPSKNDKTGTRQSISSNIPSSKIDMRPSSVSKKPFVPKKSTKPPTQSTFELSGEAYARKLKEQKEQRKLTELKSVASDDTVGRTHAPRMSQGPFVRLTNATRARLSLAGKSMNSEAPAQRSERDRRSTFTVKLQPSAGIMTPSITEKTKRQQHSPLKTDNSKGTRRVSTTSLCSYPRQSLGNRNLVGRMSTSHVASASPSIGTAPRFSFDPETDRRARENAAKKARAEAAERGRQASREWAAKEKAKKAAAQSKLAATSCAA